MDIVTSYPGEGSATKTVHSGIYGGEHYLKRASERLCAKASEHNIGHLFDGINDHALLEETDPATRNRIIVQSQRTLTKTIDPEDLGKTMFDQQQYFPKSIDLVDCASADQPTMTTCFENLEQARMYLQELNPVDSSRFNEDNSIPQTQEEKRLHVAVLFRAFKSTANAFDNEKQLQKFREEQATKYDNRKVEIMCWQLLEDIIMRSQAGSLLRPHVSGPYRSERDNQQDMPFCERFDKVVDNLKKWKTTCRLVFEAPKGKRLVDDPDYSENRSKTNKACNNKRGVWQRAGRQIADPSNSHLDSPDEPASDGELNFITAYNESPSPMKRRKGSSMKTPTSTRSSLRKTPASSKGKSAGKRSGVTGRASRKDSSSDSLYTPSQRLSRQTSAARRQLNQANLSTASPSMPVLNSNFCPLSFTINDNGFDFLTGSNAHMNLPDSLYGFHTDRSSQSSLLTHLPLVPTSPHSNGQYNIDVLHRLPEFADNAGKYDGN